MRAVLFDLDGTLLDHDTASQAGVAKPDPAVFEPACARLGLAPGRVAYVGDRLHTDALAADAAAHPSITTLSALPALLRRMRLSGGQVEGDLDLVGEFQGAEEG